MSNLPVEGVLLVGSILVFLGILTSKISSLWGIPVLLTVLTMSMLAGSDGIGHIEFNDPYAAQILGSITLSIILFHGGLDTKFSEVKNVLGPGLILSTLGVLLTTIILGIIIYFINDFSLYESMLMGTIVASTDAAAVFSILKSFNLKLKNNLKPILELESGSNDAMAYFLMIFFISLIRNNIKLSLLGCITIFFQEMIIGGLLGVCMGLAIKYIVMNVKLNNEAFYPSITLAMMIFTYSFTSFIHGNGFLSVYIAGIMLGKEEFVRKERLLWFFSSMSWGMQMIMFIVLGLLVFPKQIPQVAIEGMFISIALIFIARPLSVFISFLFHKKFSINDKLFLSWVGLRGATSIVFATFPMIYQLNNSNKMFNIVYFVVISSAVLQGMTIPFMARKLDLIENNEM